MGQQSLSELAARLEAVERQNRRLKRVGGLSIGLFLLLAGWIGYQSIVGIWNPGTMTQGVTLYGGKPFSFGEMTRLAMGKTVVLGNDRGFRGNIGANPGQDYTGLYFVNDRRYRAMLNVSDRGAFLSLHDSTNAVYLGPGLYNDGQLLLELISKDGQQGIRLGLDGNQKPVLQVIQEGEATSLIDSTVVTGSAPKGPPMRGILHD